MLASDLAENDLLLETAKRVKLLVLDDIGKEHDPKSRIFRALDYRHTRVPTVITTGLNQDDLVNHYDSATLRRMAEFRGKQIPRISVFGAAQ
jgi:DNA replication protein DnaC